LRFYVTFYRIASDCTTVTLVLKMRQKANPEERQRSLIVLLSVFPPWIANFVYIFMFQVMQGLDFTPAAFSLSGILMYMGITRLRILDLSPTVRDVLFERMRDAIIIIDRQNIIVDANRAAETLLGMERKTLVGRRIERMAGDFSGFCEQLAAGQTQPFETAFKNETENSYEVTFIPLLDEQKLPQGMMISFRDIRQRKHAEAVEKENFRMAEALQDVTIALTSTLDFDEVLDRILENIYHVLPCLMANIMLVDEHNVCKVERLKGYLEPGLEEWVKTVRFNVNEAPNLVWMAESGEPMVIPDVLAVPYWKHNNPLMRSYLGAPIKIKGRLLGFINLDHGQPGFYTTAHTERLKVFADLAAVAIENARMFKITQEMAITDSLTGLNNRRNLFVLAEKEVHRALRYGKALCVLMVDMDNFKDINDTFGHQMGDVALRQIADTFRGHLRDIDVVGRYGGDEFCIVLPETSGADGKLAAERLLAELTVISIETPSGRLRLRASVGVAELKYNDRSFEDVLFRADQALYQSKSGGRGRVTLISAPEAASTEPPAV
ncbi:MAG TPA: diguanylate cyclase, partial [Anaerolineaceae bacterium]|nr:diguanylate cyclase [Anaerolineaceae bacterium]